MVLLEKDLEDMIWHKIENNRFDVLKDNGLIINPMLEYQRQPTINGGRPDIVGLLCNYNKEDEILYISLNVIELKKDKICLDTFAQAQYYAYSIIESIKDEIYPYRELKIKTKFSLSITLIGADISNDLSIMCDMNNFLHCYLYQLCKDVDSMEWGLKFWDVPSLREIEFSQSPISFKIFDKINSTLNEISNEQN